MSIDEIATHLKCHRSSVLRKLHKLGTSFEGKGRDQYANNIDFEYFQEILIGELLGDGCLNQSSKSSVRFRYNTASKEYCCWLKNELEKYGMKFGPLYFHRNGCTEMRSISYRNLKTLYDKWYIDKQKIIPDDLLITPKILLHWYIGDGFLKKNKGCKLKYPCLATNCFLLYNDLLIKKFKDIGISFKKYKVGDSYALMINKKDDIVKFFNFMEKPNETVFKIYGYKWDYFNH